MSNKIETRSFRKLRNTANSTMRVRTDRDSNTIGVHISSEGDRQAMDVRVLIPFTTDNGNQIPADLHLTGRQARTLYETLDRYYRCYTDTY
jgi:hypothetical protein